MRRADEPVVIVGAGIGGLACAIDLAAQGLPVTIVERAVTSGGKMREIEVGGARVDSGPTVFTMRWVFDALFNAAGADLESYLTLHPQDILARHAWQDGSRFDLFADITRATAAVGDFAGAAEARRFVAFCAEAKAIYRTLRESFLTAPRPNPVSLSARIGLHRPGALLGIRPFDTMWKALSRHFHDPRLCQLFGRYATYSGSSPFLAPATLMLIAHVEQEGVWTIEGGMQRLAVALQTLARAKGVTFLFGQEVEKIAVEKGRAAGVVLASGEQLKASAVVVNADAAAVAGGLLGDAIAGCVPPIAAKDRSLSALTWSMTARTTGFELLHHNIFFSRDYRREFDLAFDHRRVPDLPTVYICAQDRGGSTPMAAERLFVLINAPANGDQKQLSPEEIATCQTRVFTLLEHCGLRIQPQAMRVTTPADFHRLFPATGGALYGRASHGWRASFQRPGSVTSIPGLYMAGGSTHPGAGVPMAALSGRLAAQRLIWDQASMRRSHPVAISGGISMASAATDALRSL